MKSSDNNILQVLVQFKFIKKTQYKCQQEASNHREQ